MLVAVLFTAWLAAGDRQRAPTGTLLTDESTSCSACGSRGWRRPLPTLEHFERSDLLARLEQLTQNRRTLAGAPRQLIGLFGQALRAIGIVVLLATIYLPVLVIPLLALAPALSDRRAARVQQRADDSLPRTAACSATVRASPPAPTRRASCAPTGSPTRSLGATPS